MFLKGLEFFSVLGFFKTDLEKSYCKLQKKMYGILDLPLGLQGLRGPSCIFWGSVDYLWNIEVQNWTMVDLCYLECQTNSDWAMDLRRISIYKYPTCEQIIWMDSRQMLHACISANIVNAENGLTRNILHKFASYVTKSGIYSFCSMGRTVFPHPAKFQSSTLKRCSAALIWPNIF